MRAARFQPQDWTYYHGAFYGTTSAGGSVYACSGGCGAVFKITIGTNVTKYRNLHSFTRQSDGATPYGELLQPNGTFYTTTCGGGAYSGGTIVSITPLGAWKTLYTFGEGLDGNCYQAGLIAIGDTMYGTTYYGGSQPSGTVFSVATDGREKVLHSFGPAASDGEDPAAPLMVVNDELYGTTVYGGSNGHGAIFAISAKMEREKVLHNVDGTDGAGPAAALVNVNGTLYGVTQYGGAYNYGTLFKLKTTGSLFSVVHDFGSYAGDGEEPVAALILVHGELYGTTKYGGEFSKGTVFELTP